MRQKYDLILPTFGSVGVNFEMILFYRLQINYDGVIDYTTFKLLTFLINILRVNCIKQKYENFVPLRYVVLLK